MALQINKEQTTGVVVSYWKIAFLRLNLDISKIYINQTIPNLPMPTMSDNNEGAIEVVYMVMLVNLSVIMEKNLLPQRLFSLMSQQN